MKKFVKLSLAAAVATAGLTSANAGALENAIKNTTILGYATYRYDDRSIDNKSGTANTSNTYTDMDPLSATYGQVMTDTTSESFNNSTNNSHKIAVGLISKINDDLSYTYVGAVGTFGGIATTETGTDGTGINYMDGNLYSVYSYFTYTGIKDVAINVGQQTIDTPFTDTYDDIAGTQEGTGITASATVAGVNLFAGYYNNSNITTNDILALAASGKVGPVALDATYIDIEDTADGYSIGAKASVDAGDVKLTPYARYTTLSYDSGVDAAIWFVGTKAKMGALGLGIDHTQSGKDSSAVAFDLDAASVNQGWGLALYNKDGDSDLTKLNVNYNVTSQVNVALNHNFGEINTVDSDETYGQLTWKPSKNFYAYLRYGVVKADGAADAQRGRAHFTYKF